MPKPKKHVFVCRNYRDNPDTADSCEARGANEVYEAFRKFRKEAGIADDVRLTRVKCFGRCRYGPNAVVYPDNIWYCGLNAEDVRIIVESHLLNDRPVKEKMMDDDLI
jgi:(2Fe-2S) ferredoxin